MKVTTLCVLLLASAIQIDSQSNPYRLVDHAPSGIFVDSKDVIYVVDSQSNAKNNPGFKRGIRVGNVKDGNNGTVTAFIPDTLPTPESDDKYPNKTAFAMSTTSGAEGVAMDSKGNIYAAEVGAQKLVKYAKRKRFALVQDSSELQAVRVGRGCGIAPA